MRRTMIPQKYPFLFWTFWGMTGLLVGTFAIGGVHTLLWLPRALQMRRARDEAQQRVLRRTRETANDRRHEPERRSSEGSTALHPAEPDPARRHDRQLHQPGADRDDAEVLLHRVGRRSLAPASADSKPPATSTGLRRPPWSASSSPTSWTSCAGPGRSRAGLEGHAVRARTPCCPRRRTSQDLIGSVQVVPGQRAAPAVRALDLLGEVRLLRGVLGDLRDRFDRA